MSSLMATHSQVLAGGGGKKSSNRGNQVPTPGKEKVQKPEPVRRKQTPWEPDLEIA